MKDATADEDGFQEIRKGTKAPTQSAKPAAKPRKGSASATNYRKIGASITRVLAPFRRRGGAFQLAIFVS